MPCHRCERVQTDPVKGSSPWARGVIRGHQVLICPQCQSDDPAWRSALDECPHCGSTRLAVVMGSIVCRECNHDWTYAD